MGDLAVAAAKTGMLSSQAIVEAVAWKIEELELRPLVVDPVMVSKSGHDLLKPDAVATVIRELAPLADVITPNAHEAARFTGREIRTLDDARDAATRHPSNGISERSCKGRAR